MPKDDIFRLIYTILKEGSPPHARGLRYRTPRHRNGGWDHPRMRGDYFYSKSVVRNHSALFFDYFK